ncbi:MAG: murein biosynthesis integral membrane protein MurJ [Propionibacteriaceae bacterium]|jgi:putative peptidoglycan lipid II flippase|nr:murein biosynthesis integral membrane protein MurJ [Propionibacteriaceae bacterium]
MTDSSRKPRRSFEADQMASMTEHTFSGTNAEVTLGLRQPIPHLPDASDLVSDRPKLLSSTMLMASGTLVSRILGLVRVLLVVYLLGANSRQGDMFSLASEIPSAAYMLLAGGILNAILVPQLMRAMSRDADGGQAFSDRIVTLFLLLLFGLTALLTIGAGLVMRVMSDSSWRDPALSGQYHSLLILAALCMPQVFFYGAFFLGGQILNARGSFGPLMWAPVLNNAIQILMLGLYAVVWGFRTDTAAPFTTGQVLLLGIGSVVGVACQAAVLLPFLRKVGFRYHPRFDFLHTGLGSTAHMAKWALALVLIDQVNYIVVVKLASRATTDTSDGAGLTVFNNAMLISLLPHALVTVSLATALLPSLSHLAAINAWKRFTEQFVSNLRLVYAAIIPVALLFITLGIPVVTLVWPVSKGGMYIGWTLMVLGAGLIPFTLRFLVNKGFNSMENTRTPFFVEIIFVVVTCLVSLFLVLVLQAPIAWIAPSLALAYTLGYVGSGGVAWLLLRRGVPQLKSTRLTGFTIRLIGLSIPGALIAGGLCWAQNRYLPGFFAHAVGAFLAIVVGVGVYWGLAKLARVPEILELGTIIASRIRKEPTMDPSTTPGNVPDQADSMTAALDGDETAALDYQARFDSPENQPILTGLTPLVPGALIADRYRLGTLAGHIGQATRWAGADESLSRPIFLTAFANDSATAAVFEAVRAASGAMDARFLRILDAGQDADCAYIVSEWADARTLTDILINGPLTSEESAWVVREVATAMASVHAMHLYHCRLDPNTVHISTAGGIKISGLAVNRALTPRDNDDQLSRKDMQAMDVAACGGLLYACLTGTWPGSGDTGLPASPRDPDGLRTPARVRASVPANLDRVTQQILSFRDPHHIASARGVADALTHILGSKNITPALVSRALGVAEVASAAAAGGTGVTRGAGGVGEDGSGAGGVSGAVGAAVGGAADDHRGQPVPLASFGLDHPHAQSPRIIPARDQNPGDPVASGTALGTTGATGVSAMGTGLPGPGLVASDTGSIGRGADGGPVDSAPIGGPGMTGGSTGPGSSSVAYTGRTDNPAANSGYAGSEGGPGTGASGVGANVMAGGSGLPATSGAYSTAIDQTGVAGGSQVPGAAVLGGAASGESTARIGGGVDGGSVDGQGSPTGYRLRGAYEHSGSNPATEAHGEADGRSTDPWADPEDGDNEAGSAQPRARALRPPLIPPHRARLWSRVSVIVLILLVVALITAVVIGLYNTARNPRPTAPTTPAAAIELAVRPIIGSAVFDPAGDGGDEAENSDQVPKAYDGDPATAWSTELYGGTYIPDQKPGVGVVFDFGQPVAISQVLMTINLKPVTLTVYVPQPDPATATSPDMASVNNWKALTTATLSEPTTTIDLTATTTQYVLIYFTGLADVDDVHQADIAEITFKG